MTQPKNPKRYQIFVGSNCVVDQNIPITQHDLRHAIQEYNAKLLWHVSNEQYERYTLRKNVIKGAELWR